MLRIIQRDANLGVVQLVRIPALGAGGRKFESCHLDKDKRYYMYESKCSK